MDRFEQIANELSSSSVNLDNDMKLRFYALYKQVCVGHCTGKRPGIFDFVARAKFDAWTSLGELSKNDAMDLYIEEATRVLSAGTSTCRSSNSSALGVSVSQMKLIEEDDVDSSPIFDAASTGNTELLLHLLDNVDTIDSEQRTSLMIATDRGHLNTVIALLDRGASLHTRDIYGQTPLHYAASSGEKNIVLLFLDRGADVSAKDGDGLSPAQLCDDIDIKNIILKAQ